MNAAPLSEHCSVAPLSPSNAYWPPPPLTDGAAGATVSTVNVRESVVPSSPKTLNV